jgi:lactoylglutathione lyase
LPLQQRRGQNSTEGKKRRSMFRKLMAVELIVRDLATCTAFYRDTLGLEVRESESTSNSVSFQIDNVYFFLLEAEGAAQMASSEPLDLSLEGSPRVLLAAGVEDVDAAYETLSAKGVRFLRPPTNQPWGLRTAYFADPEGNLIEINHPINRKPRP